MNCIALSQVNLQAPTQLRLMENQAHIEELAHVYADRGSFHELPWVAYVAETNEYVPIDGFHRLMAIEWLHNQNDIQTDANTEEVEIRYSEFDTMSEAIIAAAGVNATHGLKRQKGDIQNAIRTLLEVDRIGFMENKFKLNKKKIMATVKCSARTYEQETKIIRNELEAARNIAVDQLALEGLSQREISLRTGISQPTVNRILDDSNTHNAQMTQNEGGSNTHSAQMSQGESNTHNAQMTQGEQNCHDSEIAQSDAPNTHDAQTGEEDEQEPSVFNHITTATVAANPWAEFEREKEVSTKQKSRKINLCDDELIEILSGLSSQQRTLALNYLSDF
ncbi:hypothetical protein B5G52_11130 [Pseudoalteromonas sp. A601]|uniref:hypothetical protein n=1 Tax=Pseudoalteromonas sp. A601 TaxID=1967839 RepID=UPI000B3D0835|nr:hypothetical protein [Pseudoalteromonas sp. A601]OUS71492.1 hypothetical protein B5G52_11130 [Pseudoalteromonas sp. A601]